MEQKKIFKYILIFFVLLFSLLPLIVTFSSVLTSLFEKMNWYKILQEYVAPFEAKLVAVIVKIFNIQAKVPQANIQEYSLMLIKGKSTIPIKLEWNCLGWQSIILLLITFVTGLKGDYTLSSKIETIIVGILGTFLSNLLRMSFIIVIAYYWSSLSAVIIHDYFASLVAIIWILFFWWFSYTYILEENGSNTQGN